jgi:CheY-like chemotaxis protein
MLHLEQSGYGTVEAVTGHQAFEHARAAGPNLIIMDLAMPDGTGDEAIVWLKADPLTRDIPIVVLTALLEGPLVDRAIAAGQRKYSTSLLVLSRLISSFSDIYPARSESIRSNNLSAPHLSSFLPQKRCFHGGSESFSSPLTVPRKKP